MEIDLEGHGAAADPRALDFSDGREPIRGAECPMSTRRLMKGGTEKNFLQRDLMRDSTPSERLTIGYARVFTDAQDLTAQRDALEGARRRD